MAFTLNYCPHGGQQRIHDARDTRFRVVCTGRRFGKTLCLAGELLDRGALAPGDYGWIAPTYNVADRGKEALRDIAGGFVRFIGRTPSRAEFDGPFGTTRIWFLSADNPENIRGYGFRGLVIDEAALVPLDVWNYILRPTIAQTQGWAVFISTPKGRNWFYDMFTRGQDPHESDYESFSFPSVESPYFPASEWEDARRTLPSDVFKQEYEAQFLEDSAGVFRKVSSCLFPESAISRDDRAGPVVIGCDVAKHTDFTVLIAMNSRNGRCLEMERFNQLDWPVQKDRILTFSRKWRGRLILDATGVGDPIYDDLARRYSNIEPFKFTSVSKTALIQRLIVAIEQKKVGWPEEWKVLTNELQRYEYEISARGHLSYNAPSGFHDDCVIALALANHRRWQTESCGPLIPIPPIHGIRSRWFPRPRSLD
ncbi:hypothetical protein SCARR_01197 [Pontiella sulfatireligans]|uniref:Terminase large subunit gp17-like C-terminal domain-containing protein n=1 Tax=Pontiella sulfatireligans TaxID=2750658 RepID=A0A6C2UG44_9BACT|nr:hypothetical protein SCARR_01197 [Pontiella sulfatireligans]